MAFCIPDGLDNDGTTIDMRYVDRKDFDRYNNARDMDSRNSGFIGEINRHIGSVETLT